MGFTYSNAIASRLFETAPMPGLSEPAADLHKLHSCWETDLCICGPPSVSAAQEPWHFSAMDSRMKGARIVKDRNRTCARVASDMFAAWQKQSSKIAGGYTKQILQALENMAWEQVKHS